MIRTEAEIREHAARMALEFSAGRVLERCEGCGSAKIVLVEMTWRAVHHSSGTALATLFGTIMAISGQGFAVHNLTTFSSTHGFCAGCMWKMRFKWVVGGLIGYLCFALIIISLIALVPMLLFTIFALKNPNQREMWVSVIGIGGGLVGCIVGFIGALKAPNWAVPSALRHISIRPFQLRTIEKL